MFCNSCSHARGVADFRYCPHPHEGLALGQEVANEFKRSIRLTKHRDEIVDERWFCRLWKNEAKGAP